MNLPFFIARRYLLAKKSHNVINIISAISSAGMGIGTAALIIILSVYNGFNALVKDSLSSVEPDILISPSTGKAFIPDTEAFDWLYEQSEVLNMSSIVEESVYLSYDGRSEVARAKGVDKVYEEESPLVDHIVDGRFSLHKGQVPLALVGAGLAYKADINPRFLSPIELCFPDRNRKISLSNPASSLRSVKVYPSGLFSVNTDIDNTLLVVPIGTMRELLGYEDEVTGIEVRFRPETPLRRQSEIIKETARRLGPEYKVRDRFRQNESLYKMMRYEKASVYLILIFVIIIIAFNIFGSLTMLIIEKKGDIFTLSSLGAEPSLIRKIFILEGWLISLSGLAVGALIGILFVLLQSHLGFIRLPSSFMDAAYPVILRWQDVTLTILAVALIGYLIALLPTSKVAESIGKAV